MGLDCKILQNSNAKFLSLIVATIFPSALIMIDTITSFIFHKCCISLEHPTYFSSCLCSSHLTLVLAASNNNKNFLIKFPISLQMNFSFSLIYI